MLKLSSFQQALLSISLSTALAGSALPVSAKERITCESKNGRYKYCRVDTNGRVKLTEQLSRNSCVEGRDWGYDDGGVWVDNGCAAEFKVGGKSSGSSGDGNGTAAAIAGGLAILGALMGQGTTPGSPVSPGYPSNQGYPDNPNDRDYPDNPGYQSNRDYEDYRGNQGYYGNRDRSEVPDWAVGTFRGNNRMYNTEVELTISPSGRVSGYAGNRPVQGYFDGRRLEVAGSAFAVEPDSRGFRTVDLNDSRNRMRYYRVR